MAQAKNPYKDDPRYEVCLKAVTACDDLRESMDEYRELRGRSEAGSIDLEGQLRGMMDSAAEAFRTCSRRNREVLECTCAQTLCPMAGAGVTVAGLGMAVAMLRLQASADRLRRVA